MPKVHKKKKTARGTKTYRCVAPDCRYDDREIKPGQNYYEWTKYKQPSQYQHAKCGYPRRSQLSDSKMGSVWDAVDGAAVGNCVSVEDIEAALEAVAATAREVASEYEEAGNTSSPSAEACQTISQELDSWADDLEGWSPEDKGDEEDPDEWFQAQRDTAQEKLDEQPEYGG